MAFVFKHKRNISGNVLRRLISLFGKSDLGPLLPTSLDDNVKDLVLCPHCPSVRVQSSPSDSHPLGTSVEDLLQGHFKLVYHRRVLYFPPATVQRLCAMSSTPTVMKTVDTVEAKVAEGTEWIVVSIHVDVHVMIGVICKAIRVSSLTPRAKEYIERVGASKERSKGGMWVSVEGVVIRSPLAS